MSQSSSRSWATVLLITVCWLPLITVGYQNYQQNSINQQATKSDYAPVLQISSSEGYLPETAVVGTTVRVSPDPQSESLQILVSDDDLRPGMPPATYQYILTGPGATIFAVDQRGFLYLNALTIDADPPNPSSYQLNVQAREVDTVPIRSSKPVTININVIDVNDNAPQFEQPIYTVNVSTFGDERPVVKVLATDPDSGTYGLISYRIVQVTNGAEGQFSYDESTNTLYVDGDLTPGERYQVVIEATDGGGKSSQAIVVVLATHSVFGLASLAPLPGMETFVPNPSALGATQATITSAEEEETIQTFVTEVAENTPINTLVVSLGGDSANDDVYYTIAGGNNEGKFTINEKTGTITTIAEFDRERTAMYSLQIDTRSRHPDQHLYWTLVQISVLDVNDNSPQFVGDQPIRLRLSIDNIDQLTPNMVIGKLVVEDPDADDNGRLELRVAPDMNKLFTVSNDGVVSVNGNFTAVHFGEHRMFVVARDHGDPPRETMGEVIVSIFGTLITMATEQPTSEMFEYTSSAEEETPTHPDYYYQSVTTVPSNVHSFSSFPSPSPIPVPPTIPVPIPSNNTINTGIPTEIMWTSQTKPSSVETRYTSFEWPKTTLTTSGTTSRETSPSPRPLRLAPVFNPPQITVTVDENESDVEIAKVHASYPDGGTGTVSYMLHKGDPTLFAVSSYSGSVTLLRPLDAEVDTSYMIQISTAEAAGLAVDPTMAHFVSLTVNVGDVNDWIPNFESSNYNFIVQEDTMPGTIIGQVTAFDQDKSDPNNRIRYRLVSAGGLENYFAVNGETGLITLALQVDAFAGEKITLRVEASDSGVPSQSSMTNVLIEIAPSASQVIPNGSPFSSLPSEGTLQFSLRNYTASISESVRPPYLVQVLSVNNKPTDTRFVSCNITSGNYRGAFSVTAGIDGNCELRTQMELDRETVERYLLNVTVTAGTETDFALVSITVLDVNDNVPRFIYDNDLGLTTYFAGVSSTAGAFTRVLTVKAEDPDLGNSSVVHYALDPLSLHSKYFTVSPAGEISTKQSMSQLLQKSRISYFELRVSACDSPVAGQQLCSKADIVINVITEAHRFRMITSGLNPQQLRAHEQDMIKTVRQFTSSCTLLSIESMIEQLSADNQIRTDVYWYAVNPSTKKICKKPEYRKLFEPSSVAMVAGKVQPWFRLENIDEDVNEDSVSTAGILPSNWKTASILLVGLAVLIAIGAVVGICAVCVFWSRFKVSQHSVHSFNPHGYPQKLGTVYLPNASNDPRLDKIYETQILEMPISDEDMTMKSNSLGGGRLANSYGNYGRQGSIAYEGDFSIEENMYALNVPGRIDPVTKRVQNVVIPAPDYPRSFRNAGSHHNKSLL
uniref:Cadherin domain containing protein n=1 Tax=Haemonchus contortus TaxID=6289 RepID=A0A7I4YMM1_HAECO